MNQRNFSIKLCLLSSLSIFFIGNSYAYEAPVFDADHYPPQFDGQTDNGSSNVASVASKASQPVTTNPSAQTTDDSEAQQNDNSVDSTTDPQSSDAQQSSTPSTQPTQTVTPATLDTKTKLDTLQSEVQALRGQVDELNHNLQQLQAQQRTQYADLDKRINVAHSAPETAEAAPVAKKSFFSRLKKTSMTTTAVSTTTASQPNVAEEQQTYQVAYDLIKQAQYDKAIATLQKMLSKYPEGQFAANAHYWLGELYGLQGKNDQSANEFTIVLKQYPDSPKVSDSQLKLGLILAAQQKWSQARGAFKKVIDHYPGTASARLASEQLKQIKLAGH